MEKSELKKVEKKIATEIHYVTTGAEIYLGILGTTVGGIIVGRTIWEWSRIALGLPITFVLGLIIFAITGIYLGRFKQRHMKR